MKNKLFRVDLKGKKIYSGYFLDMDGNVLNKNLRKIKGASAEFRIYAPKQRIFEGDLVYNMSGSVGTARFDDLTNSYHGWDVEEAISFPVFQLTNKLNNFYKISEKELNKVNQKKIDKKRLTI